MQDLRLRLLLLTLPLTVVAPLAAQETADSIVGPVSVALEKLGEEAQVFEDHVVFLANPFMEGRIPGTNGMRVARDYVEHYFKKAGLLPAFPSESDGVKVPRSSWRQPFSMGSRRTLKGAEVKSGSTLLKIDEQFTVPGWGGNGDVTGPVCFVGYSIVAGPDPDDGGAPYTSFPEGTDLAGKVVLMFRHSPMDEEGNPVWSRVRSRRAGNNSAKLQAAAERGAAAIIMMNAPGSQERRADQLTTFSQRARSSVEVPVVQVSTDGAQALADALGAGDLMELRRSADGDGGVRDLKGEISISSSVEEDVLTAANVAGVLPGRGRLADQVVVLGAHLDHLGMGSFGSRAGAEAGKKLHPGADDNASGVAAVIMIADKLVDDYAAMDETADARTILFIALDAEESGLVGAGHYCTDPIVPIEDHSLMVNFDMIGRITNKRLSVSGIGTGTGLANIVEPLFEASPLEIVSQQGAPANSDHWKFYQAGIPILFGIIADFHDDYHTPRDVAWKINREDAVHTVRLFHDVVLTAAVHAEPIQHVEVAQGNRRPGAAAPRRGPEIKVRVGVRPESFDGGTGLRLASVTEGGAAAKAGLKVGDVITHWGGKEVESTATWMVMLRSHAPGDKVKVKLKRGEESLELELELQGR